MSLSLFSPRSSLSLDLNNFIKYLKHRQQTHLFLIEYIHKIPLQNDNKSVFLDQQLKQHKKLLNETIDKQKQIQQADRIRNEKWGESIKEYVLDTEGIKLINKSITRILQILKGTVDRIKYYQGMYEYQYKKFRQQFLKCQIKTKLGDMIEMINEYSEDKLQQDIELMKNIIQMIDNGEKDSICDVIEQRYQKIKNKIQQQKQKIRRVRQEQIRIKKQLQREKEEEKNRIEEKIKVMEERQKILNKNKKRVLKFIDGTLNKLYNPISQFSKIQFGDDMIYADYQQQYDKLFRQISERNKLIKVEISQFVAYGSRIEQRIKESPRKQQKQRQIKSTPRLNISKRVSTSNYNSVTSNNHSDINNYSSIQTIPQLPPIKQNKTKDRGVTPENNQQSQNQQPLSTQNIIEKHVIFIKSIASQKVEIPKKQILKHLSVFDSVKFPDKKKELTASQCLPYIKVFERTSLDASKAKVIMHNRNIFKAAQANYKNYRRSETPQMLIPLIQIGVPDYVPLKGNEHNIEPSFVRKRYLKE